MESNQVNDSILYSQHNYKHKGRSTDQSLRTACLGQCMCWVSATDGHRCCQIKNNSNEGETHYLCEVIWDVILNNDSENEGMR
jgi:hypothetical protein